MHDYANVYICARNPMLFKRKDAHEEICVLRINTTILDGNGVIVTDRNAAASIARFRPATTGLLFLDREPYHWPIGRVTFQKIAYFATTLGLPTGLQFVRGSYGPFSSDIRQLTTKLVNNGLIQETQLGKMFAVRPGPTYKDAERIFRTELAQWETLIERISDLFLRMRTQEAEVAATVHFTAQALEQINPGHVTEMAVLEDVKRWKQHRFTEEEISQSIRDLNLLDWIHVTVSSELPVAQETMFL